MKGRIFFWSITSALAGFLFGFDTVVISGAEQTIQALWNLSPGIHGIAMASALYGTVLAAANRDYRVTVVTDGVATLDETLHAACLRIWERKFARLRTTAQMLAKLKRPPMKTV